MEKHLFEERVRNVKASMQGRWKPFLETLGMAPATLSGRNVPCPMPRCVNSPRGNKDRFRFTDSLGNGNWICNQCGSYGGFKLAEGALGFKFMELLDRAEAFAGSAPKAPPQKPRNQDSTRAYARRIFGEARRIVPGDAADLWFRSRGVGLATYPASLKLHPGLEYTEPGDDGQRVSYGRFPTLLAVAQGLDGEVRDLHRTVLTPEGCKADVPQARKNLMRNNQGSAVRLAKVDREMVVSTGLETTLSAMRRFGLPGWATMNDNNLLEVQLPPGLERVVIAGDNDAHTQFSGQVHAYRLAAKLAKLGLRVDVQIPHHAGKDWNDYDKERAAGQPAAVQLAG